MRWDENRDVQWRVLSLLRIQRILESGRCRCSSRAREPQRVIGETGIGRAD
jgi:hypothetical protein